MTTIVDTFNRADAATLGTTSDSNATWTQVSGTVGITGNQAAQKTFGGSKGTALAVIAAGSADGDAQVTIATNDTSSDNGLVFRVSDGDNFFYLSGRGGSSGGLWKYSGGTTFTHLITMAALANGDVIKVTCSGSTIHVYLNGAEVSGSPVTNTFNQTVDAWGVILDVTSARLDDFSWASLPPAPKSLVFNDRRVRRNSLLRR